MEKTRQRMQETMQQQLGEQWPHCREATLGVILFLCGEIDRLDAELVANSTRKLP